MKARLSLLASALLLAGCGSPSEDTAPSAPATPAAPAAESTPPAAEDKVVHVYNWSDYIAEDTMQNFQKETGIQVVYDVYDGNEVLEAKLLAGNSGYDLVFPSARPHAQRHIEAKVYRPLDKDALKNLGNLDPKLMQGLQDVDPGNRHIVPYMWGTTGLGINVDKVRAALGPDAPLDSWNLLFDPDNAKKLAECGIAVLDDQQEAFGAALLWLGKDPNSTAPDTVQAVEQAYAPIRDSIRYFHSSKYIDDLADGSICLAMGYSGDVFMAGDRAGEAENGVNIEYIIPKEGALRWVDVMAIPADAPHPQNAHVLIDYLLRPEVIAAISDYVAYANPNLPARKLIDPEIANDPAVYPPDEVMAKLVDPKTLPDDANRERVRSWTTIKSGR